MGGDAEWTLAVEPADCAVSVAMQDAFFAEIATRYPGWTPGDSQSVAPSELAPPAGVWVNAYLEGRPVGGGGLQALDDDTAEIRRIFLDEAARGCGIGRALLAELERHARELGYERVRLTTGRQQPEALGLFRSAGYREIDPFNDGRFTDYWMEKPLVAG
jgi:GNAT superfamily N-acetyltransferase